MNREFAFNTPFDNKELKIVAAGFNSPLDDVVLCIRKDAEAVLNKHDVILLAKCVGVTCEDLEETTC